MRMRAVLRQLLLWSLVLVIAVPLGAVVLQSMLPKLGAADFRFGGRLFLAEIVAPQTLSLIENTVLLGLGVCLGSLLIGLPLGIARALAPPRGAKAWDILLLTPFMLPPYLASLGWILVLQPRGYLQQISGLNGANFLLSVPGLVFMMAMHLFPIVYFATSRALQAASGRLATVARVLGAGPVTAFRLVTLPLILPALVGSLLLVFAATVEEYGMPATLAPQTGFLVLSIAIGHKVADWPVDLAGASTLSLVLVTMAGAAFLLQRRIMGQRSFEVVTGRPHEASAHAMPPLARAAIFLVFTLAILTAAGCPVFGIVASASTRTISGGLKLSNWTLRNFEALLDGEGLGAIGFSFAIAMVTAAVTSLLAVGTALVLRAQPTCRSGWIAILTSIPNAVPGIVVSVGLILAWNQPWLPLTVYATPAMLVLAYCCILVPFPVRYASSALAQISSTLEPAARVCGAGNLAVFMRILLPLMLPSLVAAMMLVFSIAARELVASLLLAPPGRATISTFIWRQFEQGSLGIGMAMGAVAVVLTLATLAVINTLGLTGSGPET